MNSQNNQPSQGDISENVKNNVEAQTHTNSPREGIITGILESQKLNVRDTPQDNGLVNDTISLHTKVTVTSERADSNFYKIRYSNNKKGFVKKEFVTLVSK